MPKRSSIKVGNRKFTTDARPDRLDLRDFPYRPPVKSLPACYPANEDVQKFVTAYCKAKLVLDQGQEGACTGYGLAAVINYLRWIRSGFQLASKDLVSPWMLYHLARFYDEWQGESYEGSSCRGALKGWHKHGVCSESIWPSKPRSGVPAKDWEVEALKVTLGVYYRVTKDSITDMQAAIAEVGAIYVSADVHTGWGGSGLQDKPLPKSHQELAVITQKREVDSAHAFALVGYNPDGFVVQNSWGPKWGSGGFALLPYTDWLANGTDAWVLALGVPARPMTKSPTAYSPTRRIMNPSAAGMGFVLGRDPIDHRRGAWSTDKAYEHTAVIGNDGALLNRLVEAADAIAALDKIAYTLPLEYFKAKPKVKPRFVIYAHGGLNSESDSISRIRVLAPYFLDNGIYPLFVTWKTGIFETICNLLSDNLKNKLPGFSMPAQGLGESIKDAWDRSVELMARNLGAKSIWSEMKDNAARAATVNGALAAVGKDPSRGLVILAQKMMKLREDLGGELEVHLVGHSAGSFICGGLLQVFNAGDQAVDSCTLWAPACSIDYANRHFGEAFGTTLPKDRFHVRVLSDLLERGDTVAKLYRKSLLYLVSRALEAEHKTPLLGLATAFYGTQANDEHWHHETLPSLKIWHSAIRGTPLSPAIEPIELMTPEVEVSPNKKAKASHGVFDNSLDIVEDLIRAILKTPKGPLAREIDDLDY